MVDYESYNAKRRRRAEAARKNGATWQECYREPVPRFPTQALRGTLHGLIDRESPPLTAVDCICLTALHYAQRILFQLVPRGLPLEPGELAYLEFLVFEEVIDCDRELAFAHGLFPSREQARGLSNEALLQCLAGTFRSHFDKWRVEAFQLSIDHVNDYPDGPPDVRTTRQEVISYHLTGLLQDSAIPLDPIHSAKLFAQALQRSAGEASWPLRYTTEASDVYARFLLPHIYGEVPQEIDSHGRTVPNSEALQSAISGLLGRGGKKARARLDSELSQDPEMGGVLGSQMAPGRVIPDRALELRELRDFLDRIEGHRLVVGILRELVDRPDFCDEPELGHRVEHLLRLLEGQSDHALHAALVHEWSRAGHRRKHAGVSRAELAEEYHVHPRQIERASSRARQLLGIAD